MIKYKDRFLHVGVSISIFVFGIFVGILVGAPEVLNISKLNYWLTLSIVASLGGVSAYMLSTIAARRLPRAYNIAVVGFPKSGKTSLITAMFGELFAKSIVGVNTVPRGKETIETINRDLAKLEIGQCLGPTTDQDLFAYRADLSWGGFPFKRSYKLQIGDFPGDDSEQFAEMFGDWLHKTEFFKWVMEADAFIFVIDLAYVLSNQTKPIYVAKMKKAIRAAWQHILEYHEQGGKELKKKQVIMAFTKADLITSFEESSIEAEDETISLRIMELGFGGEFPKPFWIDRLDRAKVDWIMAAFLEIISYLESQSGLFSTQFVSVVGYNDKGRLGVRDLLKEIMPR